VRGVRIEYSWSSRTFNVSLVSKCIVLYVNIRLRSDRFNGGTHVSGFAWYIDVCVFDLLCFII